ncbi:MAG: 16S rRNA (guanine966-N2)-methyltransferase [Alcanivorax sp.]|jgi:16S rRNA (guanine966-N2)-methyltransferase
MAQRKSATPQATEGSGRLRIIGGTWRGRKLNFSAAPGLRPTPDRVRETVFNWLAPQIHQAWCADLFAGSGALGLEALSRGAAHCDFVDSNGQTMVQIQQHLAALSALSQAKCINDKAASFLQSTKTRYDIVFIDPPFGMGLTAEVCDLLASRCLLNPGALIYLETGTSDEAPDIPLSWRLHREKTSGEVHFRLYQLD